MNLREILNEGVSFSVAQYNAARGWWEPISKYEDGPCDACDGQGVEEWQGESYTCRYCDGSKIQKTWVSPVPDLDVSNMNARAVIKMIGFPSDDELIGQIEPKHFPEVRRRLVKILNTDTSNLQRSGGQMRRVPTIRDRSSAMPSVSFGPQIYDMGLGDERIKQYAKSLLNMIDYAQKNDLAITWA